MTQQAPSVTKFCKDCRFCSPDLNKLTALIAKLGPIDEHAKLKSALCTHRLSMTMTDDAYRHYLVTGATVDVEPQFKYCVVMREYRDLCGEEAKLFEPLDTPPD